MGARTVLLAPIFFVTVLVVAQSSRQRTSPSDLAVQQPVIRTAQEKAFKTSSVLPDCYTYAVERGDPETGPSVTYSKLAAGCKVPWHTHSANAQVLFVSGTFQLHMKGQQVQILSQGSYAYVPANHQHQETCVDGCTYYVIREGIADVHYVDAAGKELSPDIALAAVGERPAAATPTRQ
jgi:quercetin dioxygenase-like cupin family protein